jgi:hypothetical protein
MKNAIKTLLALTAFVALTSSAFAKKEKKPRGPSVSWKDVPVAVQTTIQKNLAAGKVKEVNKETVNGIIYYYAEVKGTDGKWTKICVTDTGTLVKVEPDNARNKRKHKPLFG